MPAGNTYLDVILALTSPYFDSTTIKSFNNSLYYIRIVFSLLNLIIVGFFLLDQIHLSFEALL